jgi:hypothetical protein
MRTNALFSGLDILLALRSANASLEAISAIAQLDRFLPSMALGPRFPDLTPCRGGLCRDDVQKMNCNALKNI